MYKTGELKNGDDCARNCTQFVPVGVEKVEIDETKDEQMCKFFDEDDCKFMFKYSEQGELHVYAQENKECPAKVFMLGIVMGVIAAIVLVGLAILLLWKLLTTIHDRREFARFEKERMNAKWDTVSLASPHIHTSFPTSFSNDNRFFFFLTHRARIPSTSRPRPPSRTPCMRANRFAN